MPEKIAVEIANLAGFNHAGTPVMSRESRRRPAQQPAKTRSMMIAVAVSGALSIRALRISVEIRSGKIMYVYSVNIICPRC